MGAAQSEEEGLEPTKEWVKDLIDEIIVEEFSSPDLELHWLDEDDNDSGKAEAALESRVKLGAVTLNEMRDSLGLDPYANAAADRPMVLTATGFVPIEANAAGQGANASGRGENAEAAQVVQKYSPNQPRVPAGNPGGGEWTSEGTIDSADVVSSFPNDRGDSAEQVSDSTDGADQSNGPGIQIAASGYFQCEGFGAGCQSGGSYGTTAMYSISGRKLCMDCAVKMLGIQNEPASERVLTLTPFLLQK